jgi:hypothetical protein
MRALTRFSALLLLLPVAVFAQDVDESSMGEAVERHLTNDFEFTEWVQDPNRLATNVSVRIRRRTNPCGYG